MGLRNYLRSFRGERIGQPDFELATLTSPLRALSQLAAEVLVGGGSQNTTAQPTAFVLRGFEVTDGGTVDIAAGVAMVNFRHRGEVVQGFLVGSASSGKSIPITGYGNGTYKVWIRGALSETDVSNRPAWNPYASPDPTETAKLAATRYTESWDAVIELSTVTPGAEWLEIAEITISGGAIGTITDTRNLFFEGQDANNYAAVDSEWGETATDRDDARSTYGVFGFYRAVRGLQRQVQDIIGAGGWWKAIDRNLLQLLALDGSREMEGNLLPDVTATRDLGSNTKKWDQIFGILGEFVDIGASATITAGDFIATAVYFLGGTLYNHAVGAPENKLVLSFGRFSIYDWTVDDAGINGFSLVYNAEWNGSQWDYLYSATRAYRVAIRDTGVSLEERTAATGWADNAWTLLARLAGNTTASSVALTGAATASVYNYAAARAWMRTYYIQPSYFYDDTGLMTDTDYGLDMDATSYSGAAGYFAQGDWSGNLNDGMVIMVPLDLPSGATITNFSVSCWWVAAAVAYTIELVRFIANAADPSYAVVHTISASSTGGSTWELASSSTIAEVTSVNTDGTWYAYALRIRSANDASQRRFGIARIYGTTLVVTP